MHESAHGVYSYHNDIQRPSGLHYFTSKIHLFALGVSAENKLTFWKIMKSQKHIIMKKHCIIAFQVEFWSKIQILSLSNTPTNLHR